MNSSRRQEVILDISLLGFIMIVLLISIFMAIGPTTFFFNLICLMITLILVIISYFTNIVTGLIFNLLFFFGQLVYVYYMTIYKNQFTLGYIFWLIVPTILCLLIFGVTVKIREQSEENVQLRKNNARLNALDQETRLRTLNMYDEDFSVLKKAAEGSTNALRMMVIRIRYWDSMKGRLTNEQTKELIHLVTEQVNTNFNNENFKYIIDHQIPTWGILTFYDTTEMRVIRARIKEGFQEQLRVSDTLSGINLELVISIAVSKNGENDNSTSLLADGVKELQYDV